MISSHLHHPFSMKSIVTAVVSAINSLPSAIQPIVDPVAFGVEPIVNPITFSIKTEGSVLVAVSLGQCRSLVESFIDPLSPCIKPAIYAIASKIEAIFYPIAAVFSHGSRKELEKNNQCGSNKCLTFHGNNLLYSE